jgi:hypothetical protein
VIQLMQKRWENIHFDSRQLSQMPKFPESLKRNEWPTIMKRCTHVTCSSLSGKHANIFGYFKAYKSKMWSSWHKLNMWISPICMSLQASVWRLIKKRKRTHGHNNLVHLSFIPHIGELKFCLPCFVSSIQTSAKCQSLHWETPLLHTAQLHKPPFLQWNKQTCTNFPDHTTMQL